MAACGNCKCAFRPPDRSNRVEGSTYNMGSQSGEPSLECVVLSLGQVLTVLLQYTRLYERVPGYRQ